MVLNTDYLDVKSPIVLEFDSPIEWNTSLEHYAPPEAAEHPIITQAVTMVTGITLTDNRHLDSVTKT